MKKFRFATRIALLLTALLFSRSLLYGQTTTILWLGNSYVASNNLPDMLYQLALSGGDTISYDSNTPGGYRLEDHWNSLTSQSKINQQPWDYVILQAQSQEPSLDSAFVANWVLPYADALDSVIHLNDSCTQTMFYMTWGRKNGDAQNCPTYPWVCTYQGMQDKLRDRYLQMAHDNDAIVAPCGEAWRDAIATSPTFDLYSPDESHPSLYGTYLNACVFYASIYRRSPVGLTYYAGLPVADAQFLQQIAASCVLDSMSLWNTEVYYDTAGFYTQHIGGTTYMFSTSVQSSHQWNTGAGFVSDTSFILHTFPGPGTYLVQHVTFNGCHSDTSSQWITVGPADVWNCVPANRIAMHPVPADESATIYNPFDPVKEVLIEIFDIEGRLVYSLTDTGEKFSIATEGFEEGFYTVRMTQETRVASRKMTVLHGN